MSDWRNTKRGIWLAACVLLAGERTARADEPSFKAEGGVIKATVGQELRWSFPVLPASGGEASAAEPMPAPVRVGDALIFCGGGQVYEAKPEGGILRRLALPGKCTRLEARGDRYAVQCEGNPDPEPWSRSFEIKPGSGEVPFFAPVLGVQAMGLRNQANPLRARGLWPASLDRAELAQHLRRPDLRPELEASLDALSRLRATDATNPWYGVVQGEFLLALGREDEAKKAVREGALGLAPRYDPELVAAASRVHDIDPAMGQEAFRRGMKAWLDRGYEPEMSQALILPMLTLGAAGKGLDPVKDRERLERYGEWLLDLAPHVEAASYLYAGLASAASLRGDAAASKRWRGAADAARPSVQIVTLSPEARDAGFSLDALSALVAALVSVSLVKVLRTFSSRFEGAVSPLARYNPLTRWSFSELLGGLMAGAVILWLGHRAAVGMAVISVASAAPRGLVSGTPQHPESAAFLASSPDTPAARFLRGLVAQKEGRLDDARALYEGLPYAEARVNLGVIAAQQGGRGGGELAEHHWQQALALKPDLDAALVNLGKPSASLRAERARRHGVEGPMLAIPDAAIWGDLWRERALARPDFPSGPLALFSLFQLVSPASPEPALSAGLVVVSAASVLAFVMALLALPFALRGPRPGPPRWGLPGWFLGLLVPGAARQYSFLGPFLLASVLLLASIHAHMTSSGGAAATLFDAIAHFSVSSYFGIAEVRPAGPAASLAPWASWWWLPLALNPLFLLLAERIWPSPERPRAR